jgi:alanine-glyoxylate transaminase/serine-glyoxylate transaminase/serine-pyruvate transaminase
MVVRAGREFLAIPGPTTIPDEVLRAMHRPATDIYSPAMVGMTMKLQADISRLFGSSGQTYIYIANGHGAWEAAISNVLSRGDKVLVLESGLFAAGWGRAAAAMGCEVETLPGSWQSAVRPAEVEARLRADPDHTIKAIVVVQVDTAAGVMNDIGAIGAAIRAAGHPALFMVDAVASLGCMPFDMDGWGVDLAMSAAQKGLMGPPGLGFVVANDRAKAAHQTADLKTPYWEWTARDGDQHYQKYAGTPPIHLLWALREALDMIYTEGLDAVFKRHRLLAGAVHAAATVWAEGNGIGFNVPNPAERSLTVTNLVLSDGFSAGDLLDYCDRNCGVVLGVGIGALSGKAFRVAHMGHVNAPMVIGTLGVIEMALEAMQIPHGTGGVQAAVKYLAGNVPA